MRITASLSLLEPLPDDTQTCVVAIDVLRASTTIATAVCNGCLEVVPVATIEEARCIADSRPGVLLCGERGGRRIEGFDLGNSPYEYSRQVVQGRTLVLTTTNGTVLLSRYSRFERLVGCFRNLQTVVRVLLDQFGERDVHLASAGEVKKPGLEDIACAGAIVSALKSCSKDSVECDDAALVALAVWESMGRNPAKALFESNHGKYLCNLGLQADVEYCSVIGNLPVPYMPAGAMTIRGVSGRC